MTALEILLTVAAAAMAVGALAWALTPPDPDDQIDPDDYAPREDQE
jgi:hypothetical protein